MVTAGGRRRGANVTWLVTEPTVSPLRLRRANSQNLTDPSQEATMATTYARVRRVAVVGGNRIPFARSNGVYAEASNQEMLTAAIDGLVDRYGLRDERLGEVVAGAVLKHSRDFNLTREAVLGSRLSPDTPAYDLQQACDTGIQ